MVSEKKKINELSSEFKTLNDQEKNYILGLTRTLASAVDTWAETSELDKTRGWEKEA